MRSPSALLLLPLLLAPCRAQEQPPAEPQQPPANAPSHLQPPVIKITPHFLVRRYPQDKDVAVAVVGSRTLTLGDLVAHLDQRHQPGFAARLEKAPELQRLLQSDLIAPWVRHFADLEALRQTFEQEIDAAKLDAAQSAALKTAFQGHLERLAEERHARGAPELTQDQVNRELDRFQLQNGLAQELQGMLDYLEPGKFNRVQLQNFFNANARAFGGQVTIAHILIQHRDAGTGILLDEAGTALANQRLADVRARLRPDGSNFEEVAQARSDDQRTARDGGLLRGLHRYDDRMPAALCRAAWNLRDGEISDVVETPYGWHILKRIEFAQQVFILFTDDAIPTIEKVMRRALQEERLFTARKQTSLRLLL
jgi:parvulin-like peptidyl-prolyl isomerase